MQPKFPAAVNAYWERLQGRAAFQRALKAQQQAALDQGVSPVPAPLSGN
jgi:glutathione S-transferase